jgi:hypothetical protein
MREHELDQIFSGERHVMPSVKFTKSVMDAVRTEAAAPPPIAFPWLRALPGLAAGLFTSMWILIEGFHFYAPQPEVTFVLGSGMERLGAWIARADAVGLRWVLVALVLTASCVELTWRMSGRRGSERL